MSASAPAMSVILVTPDRYETIRRTIHSLRRQDARGRLEIVIVAPDTEAMDIDENELRDFAAVRRVSTGQVMSVGKANAAGVRAASAPVVALGEDHSFPEPGWAEALLEAHRNPWAAVGPAIRNANPKTLVSWADLFVAYAPWLDPAPGGEREHLPGHNSSYKREVLLSYGPELEKMMASESVLHWDLRRKGYKLYLEPAAKTAHTNFSRLSSWLRSKFHSGRVFASSRARQWPLWKRLAFAGGSPLIPLVRLKQILGHAVRSRQSPALIAKVTPVMTLGLLVSALGEMTGYLLGPGDSVERLAAYEYHRFRHLSRVDTV